MADKGDGFQGDGDIAEQDEGEQGGCPPGRKQDHGGGSPLGFRGDDGVEVGARLCFDIEGAIWAGGPDEKGADIGGVEGVGGGKRISDVSVGVDGLCKFFDEAFPEGLKTSEEWRPESRMEA